MLWHIFVPIIAFLGFIVGVIFTRLCAEEIKPGKKYFDIIQKCLIFIIAVLIFYFSGFNIIFLIGGFLLGWFLAFDFFYLGLALAVCFYISKTFIFIISSLIFVWGLPKGSLVGWNRRIILRSFSMFFLPFVILLMPPYINPKIFLALCSGLLLGGLFKDLHSFFSRRK
ncbi:MAG: hypothetical protein U9Q69_03325 [Nanoarchaeota archaeon]|nr:hypothetical protein [Nanoarchaeota archaeon]